MAQAIFFNIPAHGHINPTLPVVQELVRRGESVTYYAMQGFRHMIETTGAHFRDYEDLPDAVGFEFGISDDPGSFSLVELARVMIEFTEKHLPALLRVTERDKPDYIVHDFTCIWGKYVGQILQLPAIATIPQFPVNLKRRPEPYPGMLTDTARMFLTGLPSLIRFQRSARRISRAYPVSKVNLLGILANHEDLNIVFTSRYFQPHDEDFDDSFVFVGPSIVTRDETLDLALDSRQGPLIYISLGTIFGANVAFYRQCFEAFGGTDKYIVLSVGTRTERDRLGQIPDNFVVKSYVPQLELLQRADVFVTHGGMNSVSEGLWYGVPLVVIPQGADQFFVGQRIEALEAGIVLDKRQITPSMLQQAVDRALSDQRIRVNAGVIRDSFHEAGGFKRAADEITKFTSTKGAPST